MENEKEEFKTGKKYKINKIDYNLKNKINTIISLLLVNLIVILFILCLLIKFALKEKNAPIESKTIQYINQNKNVSLTLSDKIKYLKILTNNDESEYKGLEECLKNDPDKLMCIYHLLATKEVIGKKRILVGELGDGCYVLLDDFENIKVAYSFGIGKNIQFDKALADKGIDVYMYDHTINALPYENNKFHWKKIGLCGKSKQNNNTKNLEELIEENGHTKEENMILKMDIEHWEWESFIDLKEETLNQFKYIALEYHFKDEKKFNINNNNLYYNVLKKIYKTHQPFYIRCNENRGNKANFGYNRICHIMEVTYIIRKGYSFKKDETIYPIYEFEYVFPQPGKLDMNLNVLKLFD